ncbi:MAG: Ig-like domain-containing protein [Lachnospiraceae bacterium]|nr:Ig-like domain-containing protein [Lachnospiraceae bacterium]
MKICMKNYIKKTVAVGLSMAMVLTSGVIAAPGKAEAKKNKKNKKVKMTIYNKGTNVTKKKITIKKGATIKLKVKVTNGKVKKKDLTYKVNNEKVVTVNKKGKVTAKKKGNAKITVIAKIKGKKVKAFVKIKVKDVEKNSDKEDTTPAPWPTADVPSGWSVVFADADTENYVQGTMDFSINLFKNVFGGEKDELKNVMVSPISVSNAMGMVMNGAAGTTQDEIIASLASGVAVSAYNDRVKEFNERITSSKNTTINVANSVWLRNEAGLEVNATFADLVKEKYGAEVNKRDFNDETVKEVNDWVKKNTNDMIDKIINKFGKSDYMHLINATCFEGNWADKFNVNNTKSDYTFTKKDGTKENVSMMFGGANAYIEGDGFMGVKKYYAGSESSFVALLPDESTDIDTFINGLTGTKFRRAMNSFKTDASVSIGLPKFKNEYEIELNDALKADGINTAFTEAADFSKLVNKPFMIDGVNHKTFIEVDENGTKAAAVTDVVMKAGSLLREKHVSVVLDRPFVYAIVDESTGLPLFIGVMKHA